MKSQEAYKLLFREYPDVVNAHQLCEMLGGINIKTAYKLLKSGAIKSFIIGNKKGNATVKSHSLIFI